MFTAWVGDISRSLHSGPRLTALSCGSPTHWVWGRRRRIVRTRRRRRRRKESGKDNTVQRSITQHFRSSAVHSAVAFATSSSAASPTSAHAHSKSADTASVDLIVRKCHGSCVATHLLLRHGTWLHLRCWHQGAIGCIGRWHRLQVSLGVP